MSWLRAPRRLRSALLPLAVIVPLLAAGSLDGCTPHHGEPADPAQMATLYGSKLELADPMLSDIRAFVSALDGKLTPHRRYGWDKPTFASAGHHSIQLAASQGDLAAEVATSADLLAGHTYTVRVRWADGTGNLILWLEDGAFGTSASAPVEIPSRLHE